MPNGDMILLDGHNRFEIAAKHNGIPFNVQRLSFECREEAIIWICNHQLGRRNLQMPDKILLEDRKRRILAEQAKRKIGGDKKSEAYKSLQRNLGNDSEDRRKNTTDYKIAKAAGTSEDTVRKIRKINEEAPEKIQSIREGKLSVNQAFNSVCPKKTDPVKQAKEEHEQFQGQKKESVVDFKSAQIDRINQNIINNALYQDVLKLLDNIGGISLKHKIRELKSLELSPDERKSLLFRCEDCRKIILEIENEIIED